MVLNNFKTINLICALPYMFSYKAGLTSQGEHILAYCPNYSGEIQNYSEHITVIVF